jgi:NTP pyrophosphatase (non-canonical NTP hydrolase)
MRNDILDLVKGLTKQDTKSLSEKALKLSSETGELASKALSYDNASGARHRFSDRNDILEEVADIMLVALSIAYSLNFDDDYISSMMHDKSIKWSSLASNDKSDGNYPYEIHLTVDKISDINEFILDCNTLGNIKPIILDLETTEGSEQQITTSSVVMGDYNKARESMAKLVRQMTKLGYVVIREKIETVPWHPVTISEGGIYYESHLTFVIHKHKLNYLRDLCKDLGVHLSRNSLKATLDDDMIKIMGTYRSDHPDEDGRTHEQELKIILESLKIIATPIKVITEYAVYDTNQKIDDRWLRV